MRKKKQAVRLFSGCDCLWVGGWLIFPPKIVMNVKTDDRCLSEHCQPTNHHQVLFIRTKHLVLFGEALTTNWWRRNIFYINAGSEDINYIISGLGLKKNIFRWDYYFYYLHLQAHHWNGIKRHDYNDIKWLLNNILTGTVLLILISIIDKWHWS